MVLTCATSGASSPRPSANHDPNESPSYGQVRHIRRLFTETFGPETAAEVEVNSVDGFQGIALLGNRLLYYGRYRPITVTAFLTWQVATFGFTF